MPKNGVSPLHAWIRFFKFVLKVSYRIGINKWHVRGPEEKEKVAARKKEIPKKIMGGVELHVANESHFSTLTNLQMPLSLPKSD